MRNLADLARATLELGETCVLCTVVRLDGSGYGQPGSRLLVTHSGERCGYISGGCLEKDLLRQVWSRTEGGAALLAFDTRGNSVSSSRYQTGCEGIVYVLCQRLESTACRAYQVLARSQFHGNVLKTATVYRSESQDAQIGDLWVIGDCDLETMHAPLPMLQTPLREATRNCTLEFTGTDGQTIEVAIEVLRPPQELVIFGAGDDVIPLVTAARLQDWNVFVAGRRPELTTTARFPGIEVYCGLWEELVEKVSIRSDTMAIMMTHDLEADLKLLPQLLGSTASLIGILGPKRRLARLVQTLFRRGRAITPTEAERIRSPIGLDIGAASPAEVAASIVAELIALRNGREGGPLFNRSRPLHERADHQVLDSPAPVTDISPIIPLHSNARIESCPLE